MGRKRGKHYIEKQKLIDEIRDYKESGVMSEKLGGYLIKIANNYASKPNFSGYSYKDEFVSEAIARMCDQIHKIDLDHPTCNPFWYLTQQCYWIFVAKINKEKKYTKLKDSLTDYYYNEIEAAENIKYKRNPDEE
jgi:hypothetical protein